MSEIAPESHGSRWTKRIRLILIIFVAWIALIISIFNFRLNKIPAWDQNELIAPAKSETWLIMGSDSRADRKDPALDGVPLGKFEGARADTMIVLSVNPSLSGISLTSIPRDLLVTIPTFGDRPELKNKINAAYTFGGPELSVKTFENYAQFRLAHYVEVGFLGLINLVDSVGGVEVCPTQSFADEKAGLYIEAGCQQVDGKTALAYSRARYSDPKGDLGRAARQQEIIRAVVNKTTSISTLLNPVAQLRISYNLGNALTVDENTNAFDMAKVFVNAIVDINSGVLPVEPGGNIENVGSVLVPLEPDAQEVLAAIRNGNAPNFTN